MKRIAILGGGLAGCAFAHYLDMPCYIFEAQDHLGGLCSTIETDGHKYDLGGHIMFSKNREILSEMVAVLDGKARPYKRNNKIFHRGKLMKYPFENGLCLLPLEVIYRILTDYLPASNVSMMSDDNLLHLLTVCYGYALCNEYLVPYNEKIWKYPLDKMATDWIDRLPNPTFDDILRSALSIETEGYTEQLNFWYPTGYGIQTLPEAFAEKSKAEINLHRKVIQITERKDEWELLSESDIILGIHYGFPCDTIISTLPIQELVKIFPVPDEIRNAVDSLRYNSLLVTHKEVQRPQNIYDETDNFIFATYNALDDRPHHRSCNYGFFIDKRDKQNDCYNDWYITETTIPMGRDVISAPENTTHVEYAYPIHTLERAGIMKMVKEYFESQGIYLLGRFAEFEYINMDEVIKHAKALAERIR